MCSTCKTFSATRENMPRGSSNKETKGCFSNLYLGLSLILYIEEISILSNDNNKIFVKYLIYCDLGLLQISHFTILQIALELVFNAR